MATGAIKQFHAQEGYGFIQLDDGGGDAFVHVTALQATGVNDLDGQRGSFDVVSERGKQAAVNLKAGIGR